MNKLFLAALLLVGFSSFCTKNELDSDYEPSRKQTKVSTKPKARINKKSGKKLNVWRVIPTRDKYYIKNVPHSIPVNEDDTIAVAQN